MGPSAGAAGLPARPLWNVAVRRRDGRLIGVADAWWEVGLVWEIDSREWHLLPEHHDRDTRRQSGFAAEGIPVVHTRPSRLLREHADVVDELRRAHAKAALAPPPEITTELWRPVNRHFCRIRCVVRTSCRTIGKTRLSPGCG